MTLEYNEDISVASIMQTLLSSWSANPVTFSTRVGLTTQSMTEWLNSFVDSQHPGHLILVGDRFKEPWVRNAVAKSHAGSYLHEQNPPDLPPEHVLASGATLAAKIALETQVDDYGEPAECVDLRRKADAAAGPYRLSRPSVWPATGPGHVEL